MWHRIVWRRISEVKEAAEGDEADDAVEESTDEVYTEEHSENLAFIASDYDLINQPFNLLFWCRQWCLPPFEGINIE